MTAEMAPLAAAEAPKLISDTQPIVLPKLTPRQTAAVELDLLPDIVKAIRIYANTLVKNSNLVGHGNKKYLVLGMLDAYRAQRDGPVAEQKFKAPRTDGDDLLNHVKFAMGGHTERRHEVTSSVLKWTDEDIASSKRVVQSEIAGLPKWLKSDIYNNFRDIGLETESSKDRLKRTGAEMTATLSTYGATDLAALGAAFLGITLNDTLGPIPNNSVGIGITAALTGLAYGFYGWSIRDNSKVAIDLASEARPSNNYFATRGYRWAARHTRNEKIRRGVAYGTSLVPHGVGEVAHGPVVATGAVVAGAGVAGGLLTAGAETTAASVALIGGTYLARQYKEGNINLPRVRLPRFGTLFQRKQQSHSSTGDQPESSSKVLNK